MSMKCQYQAAASKPKWWLEVKWNFSWRKKQTIREVDPIMMWKPWKPWKPVAMKKVEP